MTTSGNPADHLSKLMLEFYEKMASWEHSVVKPTGLSPAQMHTIEMSGSETDRGGRTTTMSVCSLNNHRDKVGHNGINRHGKRNTWG
jgi:hypothetical protein